jgi:hypothetical protein
MHSTPSPTAKNVSGKAWMGNTAASARLEMPKWCLTSEQACPYLALINSRTGKAKTAIPPYR